MISSFFKEGGFTTDALVDMSGGVEEKFALRDISYSNIEMENLWSILLQARNKKSVICCNLEPDEEINDLTLPNGLVKGHAYVVTTLVRIRKEKNKIYRLVKCHKLDSNLNYLIIIICEIIAF